MKATNDDDDDDNGPVSRHCHRQQQPHPPHQEQFMFTNQLGRRILEAIERQLRYSSAGGLKLGGVGGASQRVATMPSLHFLTRRCLNPHGSQDGLSDMLAISIVCGCCIAGVTAHTHTILTTARLTSNELKSKEQKVVD